jgi:hypothetical protein
VTLVGIFEYLLGPKDSEPDDVQPVPSRAGAGPDMNQGRKKTKTEKDLVGSKVRTIRKRTALRVARDDSPRYA